MDIENGGTEGNNDGGDQFDLKDFLENSVRSAKETGIGGKRMGVVFKSLTVIGEGADASSIDNLVDTAVNVIKALNPLSWFRKQSKGTDFDILHDLSGVVKDGEMLLVLGRPGSGCSTFLRVLANERKSYKAIEGVVTYGGVPASDFDRYSGETIYTAEEDVHFPTLTVKQSLHFALKTKTPGKRLPEQTQQEFRRRLVYMLTNMFGLTKQIDTLVGNEWIRGLSGGERKRMTLTEALTARAAINCWDGGTRGLDAASALDYTRGLRIMSDTLDKTTIASFYQASEDMYKLFDKVMVLDKGRMIYFGPVARAKDYFIDMGYACESRKSTPDFLTGVTNPQERQYREGVDKFSVPSNPIEMEAHFRKSDDYKLLKEDIAAYEAKIEHEQPHKEFRETVKQAKTKGTRASTIYTVNFLQQVKALIAREFQLMAGDKAAVVGKLFLTIIKAFIYATIYINLPLNANGAFVRGAALFSSLMFLSLMSLSELPNAMRGRRILAKHKSYAMYYPSAYHIAAVIADIPNTLMQVIAFSICAYFLEGLRLDAGAFFIFVVTVFLTGLCMTEVFRLAGSVCKSYFAASQCANIILIGSLAYNGFLIHVDKMHPWFVWLFYINPLSYGFKALIINEMKGLNFPCEGTEAVPFGPSYTNELYRTCTSKGQVGTELIFDGPAYLQGTFGYETSEMGISIFAVFCLWILFILLNCIAMEKIDLVEGGYTRQVYLKGKAPKQNDITTDAPTANAAQLEAAADDSSDNGDFATGTTFTWQDMNYTVPVKGGERQLLNNIEGWIKPGQMTALMGSSGAGKTTLLDVLAKRKTMGKVEGKVFLNGQDLKVDFERITGYVEQMDIHNPMQTVREALRFSALMRQDASVPIQEKYDYVEKVLDMMEMTQLGDALIGDLESGRGISIEERKRLTIGMELVGKPRLMYLDEPTSGLDAQSSYNIIKFIRKLADHGMPLVCTIHQPSSILFEHFDRLLLLQRGGKTVYFGDIGKDSRVMLDYFERNGARTCSKEENPAEYILQVIGAGTSGGKSKVDWSETWQHSNEKAAVTAELDNIAKSSSAVANATSSNDDSAKEFSTSTLYQLKQVYKRMNVTWFRDTTYNYGRFLNALFVGLFNGFTFYQLEKSTSDLTSRIFFIFQLLILGNSVITLAQPQFMQQRAYFRREYASKFYGFIPFIVSIVVTELPYLVVTGAVCFGVSYWTAGLDTTAERGFYFFLMFVVYLFFAVSLGQAVAAFCANIVQASIVNPFIFSFLVLFCGVLIPPQAMIRFWKVWMYPLDPYRYLMEGFVTNVLHDVTVTCSDEDLIHFKTPPGQSCFEYTKEFFAIGAPGYLVNPNSTTTCDYCQFATGNEYIDTFEWSFDNRYRNLGIFLCFWIFNIVVAVGFTYLFRKPKR
ncbi:ABC transporter G family protein [Powellomyces hirtus]|nr:ABC transporter G family protein [Powellomyces hirtus]